MRRHRDLLGIRGKAGLDEERLDTRPPEGVGERPVVVEHQPPAGPQHARQLAEVAHVAGSHRRIVKECQRIDHEHQVDAAVGHTPHGRVAAVGAEPGLETDHVLAGQPQTREEPLGEVQRPLGDVGGDDPPPGVQAGRRLAGKPPVPDADVGHHQPRTQREPVEDQLAHELDVVELPGVVEVRVRRGYVTAVAVATEARQWAVALRACGRAGAARGARRTRGVDVDLLGVERGCRLLGRPWWPRVDRAPATGRGEQQAERRDSEDAASGCVHGDSGAPLPAGAPGSSSGAGASRAVYP